MGLLYDPLSAVFLLLITGVGGLIHIYSVGYMEHDVRRARFFGYLNLFVAAMLMLVLADNYLGLFLGWEGVGLASYLLIGFWQHKTSAAVAAKKAFVVNRVGDIGMALGTMLTFATFGTITFAGVSAVADQAGETTMTVLGLLFLLAACGKSAQVPLQSWLLDAMEGPTPVSALIHAATMVTAGVYLVVRSNFIFDNAPVAQTAVVVVGMVTLLWGAVIGCAKDDIKKVLAGSTMSQIGYMMLAAGLGPAGYAFAIFHLLTHGFFKANMFLGAGSVMHAMDDDVDMRHYGALRKMMPVTFLTFSFGYLAIIGIPPFAGFWSKDKIIEAAFGDNLVVGLAALVGAGVTAFYMTRLMLMTYFGEKRWAEDVHPHESPKVMTDPADGARRALRARRPAAARRLDHRLARPRSSARRRTRRSRSRPCVLSLVVLVVVVVGVVHRVADRRSPRGAADRTDAGLGLHPGRPRRPLRRRDQRGACSCGRATSSSPAWSRFDDGRRGRGRQRHRRRVRRDVRAPSAGCRPGSSGPTPCPSSAGAVLVVLALLAVNLA